MAISCAWDCYDWKMAVPGIVRPRFQIRYEMAYAILREIMEREDPGDQVNPQCIHLQCRDRDEGLGSPEAET